MAQPIFQELGSSGLARYSGVIHEEFLPELRFDRWRKIVKQMVNNDATVGALLFAIEMLSRSAEWDFEPADESNEAMQVAEFYEQVFFEDLETTWPDMLAEIFTFLQYGWSVQEMVCKVRGGDVRDPRRRSRFSDGRIGFRKFGARSQDSLDRWEFDEAGQATAMVQRPEPDFIERIIPLEKCLHFRTSVAKGNPEGRSILRSAYVPWYFKTNLARIEAIGVERDLAGLPVGKLPAEYFNASAGSSQSAIFEEYKKIITNIRRDEQEGVLIPSDYDANGKPLFELQLLSTGGSRAFDTDKLIQRYDKRIAMCVMADFLLIGQDQTGSYALSRNKSDLFMVAMNGWMNAIAAEFNRKAVPLIGKLNAIPEALWPEIKHNGVDEVNLAELGEYVSKLSGAQIQFTPEEQDYLKRQAGLPVAEHDDGMQEGPQSVTGPPQEKAPIAEEEM